MWLFLLALGALGATIGLGAASTALSSIAWGAALVLGGLAVALFGERRFDLYSPLSFVALSFAFLYGASGILAFTLPESFFLPEMERAFPWFGEAGAISFACLLGFFFGYGLRGPAGAGARSTLLCWRPSARALKLLWAAALASTLAVWSVQLSYNAFLQVSEAMLPRQLQAIVSILFIGPFVMNGLAVAAALDRRGPFWWWASAIGLGMTLFIGVASGSKGAALMPLIVAGLAWNLCRRRFGRKGAALILALAALLAGVLFPLNAVYRDTLLAKGVREQAVGASYAVLSEAVRQLAREEPEAVAELAGQYLASRLSNLQVVANILRYQELGGARHWGESYALFFPALVPRFLWPGKPNITISQAFGVELGYGEPQFFEEGKLKALSSVGITPVGELVYNFPPLLAPLGMTLLGMLFRWLYEVYRSGARVSPELATAVYAVWWYNLLFAGSESSLAPVLSGTVKATLLFIVAFWLLGCARSRAQDIVSPAAPPAAPPGRA